MPLYAYSVKLKGEEIDKVFYSMPEDPKEVKRSLVDHDGYNPDILVEPDGEWYYPEE